MNTSWVHSPPSHNRRSEKLFLKIDISILTNPQDELKLFLSQCYLFGKTAEAKYGNSIDGSMLAKMVKEELV